MTVFYLLGLKQEEKENTVEGMISKTGKVLLFCRSANQGTLFSRLDR